MLVKKINVPLINPNGLFYDLRFIYMVGISNKKRDVESWTCWATDWNGQPNSQSPI